MSKLPVQIRPARKEDCVRLLELIQELATFEKEPEAVTVTLDHFREAGFGEKPVWWALVAEIEGQVVGMALWYIRYSTWKGKTLYLEDILVTQSHRGQGIGSQLLEALMQEAKEKGFARMSWQVLDWNEPAIAFYQKYRAQFDPSWINCTLDV